MKNIYRYWCLQGSVKQSDLCNSPYVFVKLESTIRKDRYGADIL